MPVCLRPPSSATTLPPPAPFQPLIQKAHLTRREKEKLREKARDPYRWQLAENRRNANIQRQAELKDQRTANWGDPIRGVTTPFVESFDSAGQAPFAPVKTDDEGRPLEEPRPLPTSPDLLNFQLTKKELDQAIEFAHQVTKPDEGASLDSDWKSAAQKPELLEKQHAKAVEVLRRITSLENASSKDRRHANIRRIIDTFGRHVTDHQVRQKGLAWNQEEREPKIRGGPDTGSSEVQIAILTAKIRVLSDMYAGPKGNKDKHNKRNLLLLVHRRQKLLRYMERKERGSGRWEHMLEKLGLTPRNWKDQIALA